MRKSPNEIPIFFPELLIIFTRFNRIPSYQPQNAC